MLTFEEWKLENLVSVDPAVAYAMEEMHGISLEDEIENILRGRYDDYVAGFNQTIIDNDYDDA